MLQRTEALSNPARLAALRRTGLLDTPAEETFDRLARMATRLLNTPVALVSLVDVDRQFFKSCVGLPEPWTSWRQTSLIHSFCQYVVAGGEPLLVEDARRHPGLRENLAIPDLGVIAYAGIPLVTREGHVLGSFCVIDSRPRSWSEEDVALLRDLATSVVTEIDLRLLLAREAERAAEESERSRRQAEEALEQERQFLEAVLDNVQAGIVACDARGVLTLFNRATREFHGLPEEPLPAERWAEHYGLYLPDGKTRMSVDQVPLFRALRGEQVQDVEMMIIPEQGVARTVLASGRAIYDPQGRKLGAVVAMHDITERKRAEEERAHFVQERTARAEAEASQALSLLRERQRIAMDLHDGVIQSLYAVGLALMARENALDQDVERTRQTLQDGIARINEVIREIRAYITHLDTHESEQPRVRAGLEALVAQLQLDAQLPLELRIDRRVERLVGPEAAPHVLQIAREAISNAVRHAAATSVRITLGLTGDRVVLSVRDDGRGFDAEGERQTPGHGLRNMAERAKTVGGSLLVQSQRGRGTEVRLEVPSREWSLP